MDIYGQMKRGAVGMIFFWAIVAVAVGFAAWVRLAPSDPQRWHVARDITGDKAFAAGAVRVVEAGPDGLARFDTAAQATPRTTVLAGSVGEGMVTYVTRSAGWGFPDYTTARQVGDRLEIYARLRFGRNDMGVNGRRVAGWIDQALR